MRHIKKFESWTDWFKSEPSDEVKNLNSVISETLPASFEKNKDRLKIDPETNYYTHSSVVGLYNKMISDLISKLKETENKEYTYTDCDDLVDKWMEENEMYIHDRYHGIKYPGGGK